VLHRRFVRCRGLEFQGDPVHDESHPIPTRIVKTIKQRRYCPYTKKSDQDVVNFNFFRFTLLV
jgi:hypothetical protein